MCSIGNAAAVGGGGVEGKAFVGMHFITVAKAPLETTSKSKTLVHDIVESIANSPYGEHSVLLSMPNVQLYREPLNKNLFLYSVHRR